MDERKIVSDAAVRDYIIQHCGLHTISDFMLLSMEKRKQVARDAMLELGCKPFQFTRVSGMNYETIRKLAKTL